MDTHSLKRGGYVAYCTMGFSLIWDRCNFMKKIFQMNDRKSVWLLTNKSVNKWKWVNCRPHPCVSLVSLQHFFLLAFWYIDQLDLFSHSDTPYIFSHVWERKDAFALTEPRCQLSKMPKSLEESQRNQQLQISFFKFYEVLLEGFVITLEKSVYVELLMVHVITGAWCLS